MSSTHGAFRLSLRAALGLAVPTVALAAVIGGLPIAAHAADTSTVNGYAWRDLNGDGQQQSNEPPAVGAFVDVLVNTNGDIESAAYDYVGEDGRYSFTVPQGALYTVGVLISGDYQVTKENVGDDSTDSDLRGIEPLAAPQRPGARTPSSKIAAALKAMSSAAAKAGRRPAAIDAFGLSDDFTLGAKPVTIDGGFTGGPSAPPSTPPGSGTVKGYVWRDLNKDGQQQASEPPLPHAYVEIDRLTAGGVHEYLEYVYTGSDGRYSFTVPQGDTYNLGVVVDGPYFVTKADVGSDATDSDLTYGDFEGKAPANQARQRRAASMKARAKFGAKRGATDNLVVGITDDFTLGAKAALLDGGFTGGPAPVPSASANPTPLPSPVTSPAPGGGGSLPVTGAALTAVLGAGVLLLGGGAAIVVVTRRRRAAGVPAGE